MIKIEGLCKNYGKLKAIKEIYLELNGGKIYALMGPNGSGKTTMLKCILGLIKPEKGKIIVNGEDIQYNFLYRDNIGYMPQTAHFPENLKVKEVISIIKEIRGEEKAIDFELYDSFKINEILDKTISSLSQGTKQRLSGALTFMFGSKIIILDEPTAGLDPFSANHMRDKILKEKKNGKLILFTTHIINEIEELAENLIFILEGKIHLELDLNKSGQQHRKFQLSKYLPGVFKGYEGN
jgi:Cu-processing system ATP-binding protein